MDFTDENLQFDPEIRTRAPIARKKREVNDGEE